MVYKKVQVRFLDFLNAHLVATQTQVKLRPKKGDSRFVTRCIPQQRCLQYSDHSSQLESPSLSLANGSVDRSDCLNPMMWYFCQNFLDSSRTRSLRIRPSSCPPSAFDSPVTRNWQWSGFLLLSSTPGAVCWVVEFSYPQFHQDTLLDHVLLPTFSEMILKRAVDAYIKGVVAQRYSHLESIIIGHTSDYCNYWWQHVTCCNAR